MILAIQKIRPSTEPTTAAMIGPTETTVLNVFDAEDIFLSNFGRYRYECFTLFLSDRSQNRRMTDACKTKQKYNFEFIWNTLCV